MTDEQNTPYIAYGRRGDEPGYAVGTALDELVAWAKENGCSEDELRERLEESFERSEGDE